mmetsp:Transcript_41819/g.75934  ORF Transcript_41819/g.75934 Transcript_41819/m.75934 type:complete len:402 (-) Transcript_41819:110-1315(-)
MLRDLIYQAMGRDDEDEDADASLIAATSDKEGSRTVRRLSSNGLSSESEFDDLESVAERTPNDELAAKAVRTTLHEGDPTPIPGNIYRYLAFVRFGKRGVTDLPGDPSLLDLPRKPFNYCMMHVGIVFVALVQVLAPAAILISSLKDLAGQYNPHAWEHYDWNQWLIVILAWAFLFLFILSTFFQISQEVDASRMCCRLARGLHHLDQPVCKCMLLLDAWINGYVAVVVSAVMFVVLYQEERAINVLLDALSLAFLNNIDDIASDLGFLGGVWDDQRVGSFYDALDKEGVFRDCGDPDPNDKEASDQKGWLERDMLSEDDDLGSVVHKAGDAATNTFAHIPHVLYFITQSLLVLLLLFAIPSPFIFASKAKSEGSFAETTAAFSTAHERATNATNSTRLLL